MAAPIIKTEQLNVSKINKDALYKGAKGTYLSLAFFAMEKTFPDGNKVDGYIVQDIPKEMRDAGVKGEILGNWKYTESKVAPPKNRPRPPADPDLDAAPDDIPFVFPFAPFISGLGTIATLYA
jgi:hypothetical protein